METWKEPTKPEDRLFKVRKFNYTRALQLFPTTSSSSETHIKSIRRGWPSRHRKNYRQFLGAAGFKKMRREAGIRKPGARRELVFHPGSWLPASDFFIMITTQPWEPGSAS